MKVLVTGGTGFLGTHVRNHFNSDDLSRKSGFDLLDPSNLPDIEEYDLIIHLAASLDKRPENADEVFRTNVEGTVNILKRVKENAAFIFASTKDVYGRFADHSMEVPETCPTIYSGQSALEWSKLIAEKYVDYYSHIRNFRSCIFRLSTIYAPITEGNTPSFVTAYADAINKGEKIRLPAKGSPRRDIMHVDDLSKACTAFAESVIRHGLYNIGGGRSNTLSLLEVVRKLETVSGLQAVIDETSSLPPPVPMNYVSDLSLANQELDWEPAISLDDGLRSLF